MTDKTPKIMASLAQECLPNVPRDQLDIAVGDENYIEAIYRAHNAGIRRRTGENEIDVEALLAGGKRGGFRDRVKNAAANAEGTRHL